MNSRRAPSGLGHGGRALWRGVVEQHDLDPLQVVQLTEACRAKDRLDKLDAVLRGDTDTWMALSPSGEDGPTIRVNVTGATSRANETAGVMKQLLAALRLPNSSGKRPQRRGPRGVYRPGGTQPPSPAPQLDTAMQRAQQRAAERAADTWGLEE